jgi:hypothetical protein
MAGTLQEPAKTIKYIVLPSWTGSGLWAKRNKILKNMGFSSAVSTKPGYVNTTTLNHEQFFSLPRLELPNNMTDFIQYRSWIEYVKNKALSNY